MLSFAPGDKSQIQRPWWRKKEKRAISSNNMTRMKFVPYF
jgi:hypothetical protein